MKINPFEIPRAVLILAVSLSSCTLVEGGRVPRRVPFEESAFAGYGSAGSATVSGKLVVTSSNGTVHLADDGNAEDRLDGTFITLLPVAAYTREMVDRELGDGEYLAPSDPRLHKYVRRPGPMPKATSYSNKSPRANISSLAKSKGTASTISLIYGRVSASR
jgi:hypothetical protein